MAEPNVPLNAAIVAGRLAKELASLGQEYALGGAIALGYWGVPRGTIDVDVTIFLPPDEPSRCISLLQDIGCTISSAEASESLREHGFCRANYAETHLDVFLPTIPFYHIAQSRCKEAKLADQSVMIWDAESLVVFKMMFFRRKDLADVEQVLRIQGISFDRPWVRQQLVGMYGERDPRLSAWDELVQELDDHLET